jgi:hypothetical protein
MATIKSSIKKNWLEDFFSRLDAVCKNKSSPGELSILFSGAALPK